MSDVYVKYYLVQAGGGSDADVFGPIVRFSPKYQRGRGLGGVFSKLFRFLRPALTSGLNFLKNEALNTGVDLISGISQQKPMKEILRDRSLQIVDNLRDKAVDKIKNMSGSGCKKIVHKKRSKKVGKKTMRNPIKKSIKRKAKPVNYHSKKYRVLDIFS